MNYKNDKKWCNHCREYHPFSAEFYSLIEGHSPRCRIHYNNANKRYRSANKQKVREFNLLQKQTVSVRFSTLKSNAIRRRLRVEITKQQYSELVAQPCHYCYSNEKIGIDRVNNDVGYELTNCVPCCALCNLTRNNLYSYEEFRTHIAPAIRELRHARTY